MTYRDQQKNFAEIEQELIAERARRQDAENRRYAAESELARRDEADRQWNSSPIAALIRLLGAISPGSLALVGVGLLVAVLVSFYLLSILAHR